MFSRSVILFLAACSIFWIGYVGFTLVQGSNEPPRPENTFSLIDDTIIVVHKPTEIDYTLPTTAALQKNNFYTLLLNESERIQHFYFSTNRNLMLLERSKPWTSDIIKAYAEKLQLSVSTTTSKKVSFSNDWKGEFHGKFLVLYQGEWKAAQHSIVDWKYIDRKSSLSLVYKVADASYEIEDSYFLANNTTKFISRSNDNAFSLVNDQELFQEIIPADFSTYAFYEVNYLRKEQEQASIIYDWVNYGVGYIVKQKDTCVISDFKPGQDPLEILNENSSIEISNKGKQASFKELNIPFLQSKSKIHLEVFNNVVLISNSQQLINQIIGAYETGGTLAQSISLKEKLFQNSPQKVSYRFIDKEVQKTLSKLNGVDHKTLQALQTEPKTTDKSTLASKLPPLRLDDKLISLTPIEGTNNLLAITQANTLYFIGNKQILWSKPLESALIGKPLLIGNGIFIACENQVWGLDRAGNPLNGFPIKTANVASELLSFYWNGKDYIGFVAGNEFFAYNTAGKLTYRATTKLKSESPLKLSIQGRKGDLIAHICNENTWSSISLKRNRSIQHVNLPEGEWRLVKVNGTVSALGLSKNQFFRITENGRKSMLINQVSRIISTQQFNGEEIFFLSQLKNTYVFSASGNILGQFFSTISEIEDAALFKNSKERIIVGLIDGISNNCYIYSLNGSELNKESYEGSNKITFQKLNDGTILLVSQANGYLIRSLLHY